MVEEGITPRGQGQYECYGCKHKIFASYPDGMFPSSFVLICPNCWDEDAAFYLVAVYDEKGKDIYKEWVEKECDKYEKECEKMTQKGEIITSRELMYIIYLLTNAGNYPLKEHLEGILGRKLGEPNIKNEHFRITLVKNEGSKVRNWELGTMTLESIENDYDKMTKVEDADEEYELLDEDETGNDALPIDEKVDMFRVQPPFSGSATDVTFKPLKDIDYCDE